MDGDLDGEGMRQMPFCFFFFSSFFFFLFGDYSYKYTYLSFKLFYYIQSLEFFLLSLTKVGRYVPDKNVCISYL